jgi:hypothetical protein
MRPAALLLAVALAALAGCSEEIGDECSISSDCSSSGDRICDTSAPGGYCTILGCDHESCPSEAVCIRFFTATTSNHTCDPDTEDADDGTDACSADELCTLRGYCAPRTAEIRYCMLGCEDDGDCRDGYECRDRAAMEAHGGQPVPAPGEALGDDPARFCAPAPISTSEPDAGA